MKILIFLIYLFLTKAYLDGTNYKALICVDEEKYINQDIAKSDYMFGYIFNDNLAEYYYNSVLESGLYQIQNISNIKFSYGLRFIIIELEYGNLLINKNTLEHVYNNRVTAKCEVVKNQKFLFDLLNERKKKLNKETNKK